MIVNLFYKFNDNSSDIYVYRVSIFPRLETHIEGNLSHRCKCL